MGERSGNLPAPNGNNPSPGGQGTEGGGRQKVPSTTLKNKNEDHCDVLQGEGQRVKIVANAVRSKKYEREKRRLGASGSVTSGESLGSVRNRCRRGKTHARVLYVLWMKGRNRMLMEGRGEKKGGKGCRERNGTSRKPESVLNK